jgi:hypothetical protein
MTTIDAPSGFTVQALSEILGAEVTAVDWEPVGSGQMGACYRLRLDGADGVPRRLVAKMAVQDKGTRTFHAPV